MDRVLTPSPSSSRPGSVAAMSPSEEEEVLRTVTSNDEVLRPGTSCQGGSQTDPDNVSVDSLPLILKHIQSYFGPSKTNGKMKCKFCNKEISYSATSYYNLKSHYNRQHCGEYPNLVAALSAGCKRGRHSSGGSDTSIARSPALKKGQRSIESAFKEKFDQQKALKLYYTFFIEDMVPGHLTNSRALSEFMNYVKPDFNVPSMRKLTSDIAQLGEKAKGAMSNLLVTTADSWSAHNRSFIEMTLPDQRGLEPLPEHELPALPIVCESSSPATPPTYTAPRDAKRPRVDDRECENAPLVDDCNAFAKMVGGELREMDVRQRTIAKKVINEALFHGLMGSLAATSVVQVNTFKSETEPR